MKRSFGLLFLAASVVTSVACLSIPTITLPRAAAPTAQLPTAVVSQLPQPVATLQVVDLPSQDVLTRLYTTCNPGVVAIRILSESASGLGSGFVYDSAGHIVTNYHVVEGATELEVDFANGLKTRGRVIGTDLDSDLAVVQVDVQADQLTPLPVGDSDLLQVGQTVAAIGNPFGLNGTMTVGIVSAKGRTSESLHTTSDGGVYVVGDVIQTDAAINPGNSGGPLLNLSGEVVGVNREIRTNSTSADGQPVNSGIGFAVSSNIVRRVVPELIRNGHYDYPYLGISSQPELTLVEQEALGLSTPNGAYVVAVVPGGPADKAGLRGGSYATSIAGLPGGGDLITALDGHPIQIHADLISYLVAHKSPGDTVVLTILRDNQVKEVTVTLGKRP